MPSSQIIRLPNISVYQIFLYNYYYYYTLTESLKIRSEHTGIVLVIGFSSLSEITHTIILKITAIPAANSKLLVIRFKSW